MRNKFDRQLNDLNTELIKMGALCEEAIATTAQALIEGNVELARKLTDIEREIDSKERDIENFCLKLILQQQPVAGDLRLISAALKMITDLERIGDQSRDIAELIEYLGGRKIDEVKQIGDMAIATRKMVTESIDAFVRRDEELAAEVIAHDDVVDEIFIKVKEQITKMIMDHPDEGEFAMDLLMIAKYFERIGDHAVNVGEWVIFSITGIHKGEREL
ncbi:MAG TPA: phosphate signaling complex protein PhoU [Firmicutes bacterium]|nr:phosphate signaling complex protein PhoU [Bacillota bacterium]